MGKKLFFNNSQRIFKLFRVWSYEEGTNKTLYARFLKWMTIMTAGAIMIIISLSETIHQMRYGQLSVGVIKALYLMALGGCTYKLTSVALFDDEICACINRMENFSEKIEKTPEIGGSLSLYNKLFIVGMFFMNISLLLFYIEPFTRDEPRCLPFTPYLPYLNTVKTPNWQLIYLIETVASIVLTTSMIAYDTLFCGMMSLCSSIVGTICRELRKKDASIDDHRISDKMVREIVLKIIAIEELTGEMSDIFSGPTMVHMIYSCSSLVFALFMVMLLPFTDLTCITMMMIIMLQAFQLWIYCYFGQNLVNQREVLQMELYSVRWYDASKNFKGMLMLALLESQIHKYIYAGKIIPLSMETLATVIRKAYMIVTFLNEAI